MAIARDTDVDRVDGGTSSTSVTVAITCTGSNMAVIGGCAIQDAGATHTSATFDGNTMTAASFGSLDETGGAGRTLRSIIYYRAIGTGSETSLNVVMNVSENVSNGFGGFAVSYTGVDQTTVEDDSDGVSSDSTSGLSTSTTSNDAGDWAVSLAYSEGGTVVSDTNFTVLETGSQVMGDSDGTVGTGTITTTCTHPGSRLLFYTMLILPAPAAPDIKNHSTLTTSLVSYWDLEEASGTRYDLHGSNNLTDNNTVTQGTGKIGNCADFERSNSEYLSITDASQTGLDITGDMSISFWMKLESAPAFDTIYSICNKRNTATSNGGYQIQYTHYPSNTDTFQVVFYDGSTNVSNVAALDMNLSTGTWYHFVITIDVSTPSVVIYKDGSDLSYSMSLTNATAIGDNSEPFRISQNQAGDYFDGLLEEFGIWSKVLTTDEITDLYNSGDGLPYYDPDDVKNDTTLSTSLESYWTMDETTGDRVDSLGVRDMTPANNTTYVTGVLSNAVDFDGTDDYLSYTGNTTPAGDYSVSAWIKADSFTSDPSIFQDNWTSANNAIQCLILSTGELYTRWWDNSVQDTSNRSASFSMTTATWYHCVWSVDVSQGKDGIVLYVDGVNATSYGASTNNATSKAANAHTAFISSNFAGTQDFNGAVDEVALYNKALSVAEVRALYGYGTPPVYEAASTFTPRVMMY